MGEALSAVMPVKLTGRHYADNVGFCDTLFCSFRHFGLQDLFSEFLIIVVPDEAEAVRNYAKAWSDFPIRILPEDELLPIFQRYNRPHQVRPWHRQQMIKMACSSVVTSGTFLSLDPDVIAVKPVTADMLMPQGLPLLDPEPRSAHSDWWRVSATLLGVEPNLSEPGIHVTPFLFRTDVWAKCLARLEEVAGKPWDETLITRPETWTEGSLYYLTLENFFEPAAVHCIGGERRLHSTVEFWSKEDFEQKEVSAFFSPDNPGMFGVLSSFARVDPHDTARRLAPWIPVTIQPYTAEESLRMRVGELSEKVVRYLRLRFKR